MPKWEYQERQARLRFLCKVSPISNFLHSHDDRFAAQIVLSSVARQGKGGLADFSPPLFVTRGFVLSLSVND